jgi:signal transduction histidine kinase
MKERDRYKILFDVAKKLNSNLASEEVLRTIVEDLCLAANAKGCSLMLLTPEKTQLMHTIAHGLSSYYVRKGPVRADAAIVEALKGKPLAIDNATNDPRVQYQEAAKKEGIASILSLPLVRHGDIIGIARIYTSEPHKFSEQEVDFYSALANLGAIALERAELHESIDNALSVCQIERKNLEEDKVLFLRFLSMAAHDLKAPLSAIQSFLRLILDGFVGEINEKQRHMMERSSQRITELFTLISDLLDIPRIEKGQIVQEMVGISPAQIINSFTEEGFNLAKQKGIKFSTNIPPDLPDIMGSPSRLKQVVANLVTNAVNYTTEGEITVKAVEQDTDILIEISDTGTGIPADELSKVFEDFIRGSNAKDKGTGLGLSISKRIIEAHGGRIWVESPYKKNEKGSRFSFTLPKKPI